MITAVATIEQQTTSNQNNGTQKIVKESTYGSTDPRPNGRPNEVDLQIQLGGALHLNPKNKNEK